MMSLCLHLGNLNFSPDDQGSKITNENELKLCAEMFQVEPAKVIDERPAFALGCPFLFTALSPSYFRMTSLTLLLCS